MSATLFRRSTTIQKQYYDIDLELEGVLLQLVHVQLNVNGEWRIPGRTVRQSASNI
jgi:hypothetical protein